jgi:hypothetical protein
MASRIEIVDDLDGSPATQKREFTISGRAYELDLSDANAKRFDDAQEFWIMAARHGVPRRRRTEASRRHSAEVRKWARERGMLVTANGRLPANVLAEWEAQREKAG